MHIYIYDTYLSEKKYDSVVARIETRTTDLGLNGKIIRLGMMHSLADTIVNEIRKGAKTITAVGNDNLFHKTINVIARLSRDNVPARSVPVGFIPVGRKNNVFADCLGIALEEEACNVLSARRIECMDLGLVNDEYFLAGAVIGSEGTKIEIDGDYSIEIMGTGQIGVINLPLHEDLPDSVGANAQDGVLELLIKTKKAKKFLTLASDSLVPSVLSFRKLKITNSRNLPMIADEVASVPTPAEITIAREKINLIVGKGRKF